MRSRSFRMPHGCAVSSPGDWFEIGDREGASRELAAAYLTFQRLGARPEREKASRMDNDLGIPVPGTALA